MTGTFLNNIRCTEYYLEFVCNYCVIISWPNSMESLFSFATFSIPFDKVFTLQNFSERRLQNLSLLVPN